MCAWSGAGICLHEAKKEIYGAPRIFAARFSYAKAMRNVKRCLESGLALTSACVGAGFATGREILSFFTRFGVFSWLGCVVAAALLGALCFSMARTACALNAADLGALCRDGICGGKGNAAAMLYAALLTAVGGAMLAATGEAAALMAPVRFARQGGILLALAGAYALRNCGLKPLAALGVGLVPCCAALFALLLRVPAAAGKPEVELSRGTSALVAAACYAGLNASLSAGVMCEVGKSGGRKETAFSCAAAAVMIGGMLLLGNAALMRQYGSIQRAALPVVALSGALGPVGYWLCATAMLIAVLTSYLAAVRALARMMPMRDKMGWLAALAITALVARLDFTTLIGYTYPALGAMCLLCFFKIFLDRSKVIHN